MRAAGTDSRTPSTASEAWPQSSSSHQSHAGRLPVLVPGRVAARSPDAGGYRDSASEGSADPGPRAKVAVQPQGPALARRVGASRGGLEQRAGFAVDEKAGVGRHHSGLVERHADAYAHWPQRLVVPGRQEDARRALVGGCSCGRSAFAIEEKGEAGDVGVVEHGPVLAALAANGVGDALAEPEDVVALPPVGDVGTQASGDGVG